MKFLVCYSRDYSPLANVKKPFTLGNIVEPPKSGSFLELETMDDLIAFQEAIGHEVIVHKMHDWSPSFLHDWDEENETWYDQDTVVDYYTVDKLPKDYKDYRWIEIYNGYRE